MALDSLSDAHDAEPDEPGVSEAGRADQPGSRTILAESRDRSEYYDALQASQGRGHDTAADGTRPRSGWDTAEVADHVARPSPDSILVNAERASHILDGDPGVAGTAMGQAGPGRLNSRPDGTTRRSSGSSWTWRVSPTACPSCSRTRGGGYTAIARA